MAAEALERFRLVFSGWLLILVVAVLVLFGVWKIAELIWAAFLG